MRVPYRSLGVVVLAAPLVFGGCHRENQDDAASASASVPDPGIVSRDTSRKLGAGDIRIVSTDSAIEVAVVGPNLVTGLGPRALAEVKKSTDTAAVSGTGLAANLEKLVKSSVQSALNNELVFAIASVGDVKAESAGLEFYDNSGKRMAVFGKEKSGSGAPSSRFSEADSRAFIAAFHARKATIR